MKLRHIITNPAFLIIAVRAATKVPGEIANWWQQPSSRQITKVNAHLRTRSQDCKRQSHEPEVEVSLEAEKAYRNGIDCWRASVPGSQARQRAEEWLKTAAQGGHADARRMARMHQIEF